MFTDRRWAPQIGIWLILWRCLHAELHSKVSGARVGRMLIYVCVKCGHASPIRRLDGHPKAKGTGHDLNARRLGTPLGAGGGTGEDPARYHAPITAAVCSCPHPPAPPPLHQLIDGWAMRGALAARARLVRMAATVVVDLSLVVVGFRWLSLDVVG